MTDTPDEQPEPDDLTPTQVEAVWIDRSAGNGSLSQTDGWSQNQHSEYEFANDGRSDTRTTFYWTQNDETPSHMRSRDRHQQHRDPEDRRSWDELAKWNDGVGEPSRKQDNFEADVRRWTQTFCNQLNLTDYQYKRVLYVVEHIEMGEFGWIPAEHIILGTISLVIDSETDADPEEWSPDDWIVYRDDFEELMEDTHMERGTLWTVRKRIHHESDVFEGDEE